VTQPVAGMKGGLVRAPGRAARLLPLLSAFCFALLAVAMGVDYEREMGLLPFCHDTALGANCLARSQLLASLAGVWAISAVAVLVLMAIEIRVSKWSRGLHVPPRALLADALFLVGLGAAGLIATQPEGYGQIPRGIVVALVYTYLTGALFLFALTFLGYRPHADSLSRSVVVAGVIHGIIGMIMAVVFAFFAMFPPIIAY
jgi:hypothetical protein